MALTKGAKTKTKQKSKTPSKVKVPVIQAEPDMVNFDIAVTKAKLHIAAKDFHEIKIGQLADGLEPDYGAKILLKFAQTIGISYATVKKYRTVFRKFPDRAIGENSLPFGVLAALAPVENGAELLDAKPDMKVPEALALARAASLKKGKKKPKKSRNDAGTIRAIFELAQKVHSLIGHVKPEHIDADILRDELARHNPEQAFTLLRRARDHFDNIEKIWKEALATPAPAAPPPPMWTEATETAPTLADATTEPVE